MQRPDKEPPEKTSDVKYAFVWGLQQRKKAHFLTNPFATEDSGSSPLSSQREVRVCTYGCNTPSNFHQEQKRKQFGGNYGRNVRQEAMFLMMRAEEQIKKNESSERGEGGYRVRGCSGNKKKQGQGMNETILHL